MTAKEYISQVPKIDKKIRRKLDRIEELRTMAEGLSGGGEGERVQSGKDMSKMANAIVQYITEEEELKQDVQDLLEKRKEVLRTIESLEFDLYDVLYMRYLNTNKSGEYEPMEFEAIGEAKGRSYSWATKTHGVALRQLQIILNRRSNG